MGGYTWYRCSSRHGTEYFSKDVYNVLEKRLMISWKKNRVSLETKRHQIYCWLKDILWEAFKILMYLEALFLSQELYNIKECISLKSRSGYP